MTAELMAVLQGALLLALSAAAGFLAKWAAAKAKESQARAIDAVEYQIQEVVDRNVQAVEQESKQKDIAPVSGPMKKEAAERGIVSDLKTLAIGAGKTVGKQVFWGLVGNIGKRVEKSVFSEDLQQRLKIGGTR